MDVICSVIPLSPKSATLWRGVEVLLLFRSVALMAEARGRWNYNVMRREEVDGQGLMNEKPQLPCAVG